MRSSKRKAILVAFLLTLAVVAAGCPKNSKTYRLVQASGALADGIKNAQEAVRQGVLSNVVSIEESAAINTQFARVAQAGLTLDQAIRANESAESVDANVNLFLEAFNSLAQNGVLGIKNENVRLTVRIALQGAQTAVSTIVATLGE